MLTKQSVLHDAHRRELLRLLAIKDSDIRIANLEQCRYAVDKGIHAGGAFSAVVPLVALYYGGFLDLDIADPTRRGQDMFTLSKGHAVATLASVFADIGYIDPSVLRNSRSYSSNLNGHPGPLLPGVHVATGPMGQGLSVAQGFAIAGKASPRFDSYCLVGDGELQEGPIWEGVMYAGAKRLDNLCVLVDRNYGQLDISSQMVFPMPNLEEAFDAFGWQAVSVDATGYDAVVAALESFRYGTRNGRPTAIICHSTKGHGAFSDFLNKHKVTMTDAQIEREIALQTAQRDARVREAGDIKIPAGMHLDAACKQTMGPVLTRRVPPRDPRIRYDSKLLPGIDRKKEYASSDIVTETMKVFAVDPRVVSVDSDLATTSGLQAGVAAVDQQRALNVGVAEANMMCIGEAFAALGCNTWVSTFCPFFDWKVLRRIAVGYQERMESIAAPDGWLSEGHGLDLTFLATGPNFETRTNGATHMGNDDVTLFDGVAQLKIIDVSCPQQLLGVMKWIMEGNRGLVYVRVMRAPSAVIYDEGYTFEFGKAYVLKNGETMVVTSGRGVHEALSANKLESRIGVVDMASVDEALLLELYNSGKRLCFAEQNNGYLLNAFIRCMYRNKKSCDWDRVSAINALDANGNPQYIHSGTYEELLDAFRLSPSHLIQTLS